MSRRDFDVVVWGATGFTGKLVAEYLASKAGLRWAIAGRSREKLEAVRGAIGQPELPLLVGDSHDRASLDAIVARTKAICSTVGPFAKFGSELVAACVAGRTHYCDITGETHWIRKMIDRHHDAAREHETRIVPCCGFDSIPSDLGTHVLQQQAVLRYGAPCQRVTLYVERTKGSLSGGTVASMANIMEEASRDQALRRLLADPYALNPEGERRGPDPRDDMGVGRAPDGAWTAPFIMAAINTRVVRRSNALLGYPYGREFRYAERTRFPASLKGMALAGAFTGGLAVVGGLLMARPTRRLLLGRLPAPGEGPSRQAREQGYWRVRLCSEEDGAALEVRVEGDMDPGYGDTAKMLAESALCLAGDPLQSPGGLLTPASAMGDALVERLRRAAIRFVV